MQLCLGSLLLSLALLLTPTAAKAGEPDARFWVSAEGRLFVGAEWSGSVLLQPRFSDDIGRLERFLIRPSIDYFPGNGWALTAGYDAHLVRQPSVKTEHRIWQQVGLSHDLLSIEAAHRLRVEERFIEDLGGIAPRLRYRIRGTQRLPGTPWYLALGNEVFFNLGTRSRTVRGGFGEDRLFAGMGYRAARGTKIEAGYQLQYIDRPGREDAANHTLVLSVSLAETHP
jgi:hypothetical protein